MLPRGDGPFLVLERINDNAYKLDFPGIYNVSATFKVIDLSPFEVGDDFKTNPFRERGGIMEAREWSANSLEITVGPMTRTKAKRFKEALNVLIRDAYVEKAHVFNSKEETKKVHAIKVNPDLGKELGHF